MQDFIIGAEKILKIVEKISELILVNLIQFQDNLLKFWVNFQENILEIRKSENWKKVGKIFRNFWVNFTLRLTKLKWNFGTNSEKVGIFVNSFMKHNIKLIQKELLSIF